MIPIPFFSGGWSYTPKEMNEFFKNISYKETMTILEFGSGDSTLKIYNHIKQHYANNVIMYTYESDPRFIETSNNINYISYNENNINTILLPNIKFDIVLIDGPNGDKRSLWYSKIKNNVYPGTILLIDDFNHYESFGSELDKNFEYELLSFSDEPFVANGEHSWKIVRIVSMK
jgi:hypothetical protein